MEKTAHFSHYIKTSTGDEEDNTLLSRQFLTEDLLEHPKFEETNISGLEALIEDPKFPLSKRFNLRRNSKERPVEEDLIIPVLKALGLKEEPQGKLDEDSVDFVLFPSEDEKWIENYSNTYAAVEAKRYGRLQGNYTHRKKDNSDPIYQVFNYLKDINTQKTSRDSGERADYIILTDGYLWRLYSRHYTYSIREFQKHFVEFDLERIAAIPDPEERKFYLRIFATIFSEAMLRNDLSAIEQESNKLQTAMAQGLRVQALTSLESIATALWREITSPSKRFIRSAIKDIYGIETDNIENDMEQRRALLELVYSESITELLRLIFVLFCEARDLWRGRVPKTITSPGGILEAVVNNGEEIGEITNDIRPLIDDDAQIKGLFGLIDELYDGNLFSRDMHQLLEMVNMDDTLFINAIDNLCRVKIGKENRCIDFSALSIRDLGTIYESLLEYKLSPVPDGTTELPSIVDGKRKRRNIKDGDLMLVNSDGLRKSTGSYFTNEVIVEHLIRNTVGVQIDQIKAESIKNKENYGEFLNKVIQFLSVCDTSVGSGHFLLGALNYIVNALREALVDFRDLGLEKKVIWNPKLESRIKSQVARKCLFGVDLNPDAINLTKLSIWMSVFDPDRPFEFLSSNLINASSIIGTGQPPSPEYKLKDEQVGFMESRERIESRIQAQLLNRTQIMSEMPRKTREQVEDIKTYYDTKIVPLREQIDFLLNVSMAETLAPEYADLVQTTLDEFTRGIDRDPNFLEKILLGDSSLSKNILKLKEVNESITQNYKPLHFWTAFPQVMINGGFSTIVTNPPWNISKVFALEALSDWSSEYPEIIKLPSKKALERGLNEIPDFPEYWEAQQEFYRRQNAYYNQNYQYQAKKNKKGKKTLKGDTNLYKLFVEKIYDVLRPDGLCGIVIPDNLNIDAGTAGLRELLLTQSSLKSLVMFENRLKIFADVDSRYKFNVMTFQKSKPRKNGSFYAGFYWQDVEWLAGRPEKEHIAEHERHSPAYHKLYRYPYSAVSELSPVSFTITEYHSLNELNLNRKLLSFPAIGDESQEIYIKTYREFDMTNDSDLFKDEEIGWPLFQGKMIWHFDSEYAETEKWIDSQLGNERLSKRKKQNIDQMPNKDYRIGWRSIAAATNARSLVSTVLPPFIFTGNSILLMDVIGTESTDQPYILMSGINTILSSFVADFIIRSRVATNISSSFVKEIPVPRNKEEIMRLGEMALPLYKGEDMEDFRNGVEEIIEDSERQKLQARLDAEVAHLYGLTYEEYQLILSGFTLVDESYKKECLRWFNKLNY